MAGFQYSNADKRNDCRLKNSTLGNPKRLTRVWKRWLSNQIPNNFKFKHNKTCNAKAACPQYRYQQINSSTQLAILHKMRSHHKVRKPLAIHQMHNRIAFSRERQALRIQHVIILSSAKSKRTSTKVTYPQYASLCADSMNLP